MEEEKVSDTHLSSAVAFVEGGIQEACDDSCSICLEAFCDNDPSTVTSCKHEYHLQCILEWCQRSSHCPMCWQAITLKDPNSQELLDAVEHERNIRMNPPRNTTIFHHPTLGDFELQHLPVSGGESELEERIIQHLTAAAAMGRARHLVRRNRFSNQNRPQFLVFSTHPNAPSATPESSSVPQSDGNSPPITVGQDFAQIMTTASVSSAGGNQQGTSSNNRSSPSQTPRASQDRAGTSDSQSLSDSLKSRFSALSTRYKDSIAKRTRGWKERLFTLNNSTPEPSTEVRREVDPNISSVSQMMDHLEIATNAASSNNPEDISTQNITERQSIELGASPSSNEDSTRAPCAAATSNASN